MSINNMVTCLRQVPALSAQGLQLCFSALPCYFCHDILGKEKFLLLFLLFYFTPVREVGVGQPHCSAVLSNQGSKEGDTVGTSPSSTSWALPATALVAQAGSPSSAIPNDGNRLLPVAGEPSSVTGDGLGGLHNCKESRLSRKSRSHSVQIQKILDGLKCVSSLCTCRVSLRGCWGWGTLPAWEALSDSFPT